MKKIWEHLSILSRYYITSILSFFVFWGVFSFIPLEFLDKLFFMMAFVWHFTLLTPGLKEKMLINKQRFSFLNVVVRVNYYLQLFIKLDKITFGAALVRAISPLLFTFLLMVVGGNGNMFFTLLGSFCFEVSYYLFNRKTISRPPNDLEIPPAIPSAENFHE